MKAKFLKIFLAMLLIITLTSANFILIGFNSISYAVEKLSEDKDTSHKNIEFMAYFKDDSQNETMESSTTTEKTDLKLYFNVNVKQEGYFDGKITLKDSNFKFKTDTENERIQNITEDTITLNQINAGDIVEIPVDIELVTDTSYDISLLNAESKLELTGTYKDSTEKDITVTGTRTVNLKITSPYNTENNELESLSGIIYNASDSLLNEIAIKISLMNSIRDKYTMEINNIKFYKALLNNDIKYGRCWVVDNWCITPIDEYGFFYIDEYK